MPPPDRDAAARRICLVGNLAHRRDVAEAAASFGVPVVASETGEDLAEEDDVVTHFVLPEFEGRLFEALRRSPVHRILGPTALLQLWKQNDTKLPDNVRPLYSLSMRSAYICFTGFRVKEELTHLINLIHYMGGSIRKDMTAKVTHLIANSSNGDKYRYAVAFRVPTIGRAWVEKFWADRDKVEMQASDETLLNEFKVKPFLGSKVCFVGFSEEECQHMTEILLKNGGEITTLDDPTCSHVVVANRGMYNCSYPSHPLLQSPLSDLSNSYLDSPRIRLTYGEKKDVSFNVDNDRIQVKRRCTKTFERMDEQDCSPILKRSLNSTLANLFYPDEELSNLILPSMSSIEDSNSTPGKKRARTSIESNFEVEAIKVSEKSDWRSPFKKLKLKNSFKFKSKDQFMSNIKKEGKNKETSPEKDEHNTSFMSSSGIFNISISSIHRSKTMKSVSKIRRSVKSLTASFRGERKKKYVARAKDTDEESPGKDTVDQFETNDIFFDISPVSTMSMDISHNQPTHNTEKDIASNIQNVEIKDSPGIFKTPKGTFKSKKTRHTLCGPVPIASSPIISNGVVRYEKVVNVEILPSPQMLYPKKSNSEARPKTNMKTSLDCSILSVVDEHNTQKLPDAGPTTHIVRAEWFWISVQNEEAQDEKEYLFEDYLDSQASPSRRSSHDSISSGASANGVATPSQSPKSIKHSSIEGSAQRIRKRKLRGAEGALHKRRSSVGDAVLLSLSSNLLDCTQSPDGKQSILDAVEVTVSDSARKHMSPRQQVFMELVQTESNYVGILHTIVTIFKQPLEEMSNEDDPSKALLNNTELKIIFGNLVPIYEIHRRMLEELKWASHNWSEEISIGKIVLKYASDLVKAYPPFVNFFENMKEMLNQCDKEKPRFHAFLKGRQTKPECGRQTLQELMIRPVQRLGSINLLLDDILKHTNKTNPDHTALESAIVALKEVMTHVNEDKRKTEGQQQMFNIMYNIENCPAFLVSSQRSFVAQCDVMELSKDLSGRGDHLVLFLFSDVMEVCKKKSKVLNSKSPTGNVMPNAASKLGCSKPYRHVEYMSLSTIKRVVDIRESEECHKVFALVCRSNQELKEKLYAFTITDDSIEKTVFLKQLCRQMANTVCKTDAEKFLACLESHQLDIDTSDIALGTLSKAFKFASRTRLKVGRAFSFNKTPSKLKRAVSSMISPFGSTSNLTPASQLAQMRLASCNNINELGVPNSGQSEVLVAPMSVQPTRKAKATTLSSGALRRL